MILDRGQEVWDEKALEFEPEKYKKIKEIEGNISKQIDNYLQKQKIPMYHVTASGNVPNIKQGGIQPQEKSTWTGAMGQELKDKDKIYAFTNKWDAIQWASKQEFDTKEPVTIIQFEDSMDNGWEKDTHFQAQLGEGDWLKKKGTIPPIWIKGYKQLTPEMTREFVQRRNERFAQGGTGKIYVSSPDKAPKGVQVKRGKKGGMYYEKAFAPTIYDPKKPKKNELNFLPPNYYAAIAGIPDLSGLKYAFGGNLPPLFESHPIFRSAIMNQIDELLKGSTHQGLIQQNVMVHRGGKVFQRKQWVKPRLLTIAQLKKQRTAMLKEKKTVDRNWQLLRANYQAILRNPDDKERNEQLTAVQQRVAILETLHNYAEKQIGVIDAEIRRRQEMRGGDDQKKKAKEEGLKRQATLRRVGATGKRKYPASVEMAIKAMKAYGGKEGAESTWVRRMDDQDRQDFKDFLIARQIYDKKTPLDEQFKNYVTGVINQGEEKRMKKTRQMRDGIDASVAWRKLDENSISGLPDDELKKQMKHVLHSLSTSASGLRASRGTEAYENNAEMMRGAYDMYFKLRNEMERRNMQLPGHRSRKEQ
jgi:hypothetical protein